MTRRLEKAMNKLRLRRIRLSSIKSLRVVGIGLGVAFSPYVRGQNTPAALRTPQTFTVSHGRVLADAIDRVQEIFSEAITYEDAPLESTSDLRSITVVGKRGLKQLLVAPDLSLSVTLDQKDATPYLAAHSVLSAYHESGGTGEYTIVQQKNRVDVVPSRFKRSTGSISEIKPLMSQSVTFEYKKYSLYAVASLITKAVSSQSGYKVVQLSLPGNPYEEIEIGSTGESAADVVQLIGEKLHRPISFQCLYEPNDKAFYLNIYHIGPSAIPGTTTKAIKAARPINGAQNSPFFKKTQ